MPKILPRYPQDMPKICPYIPKTWPRYAQNMPTYPQDMLKIWSKLLTGGSYWPKTNESELHFARSFEGHPNWPYLAPSNARPNMPNMAKYAFLAQLHVLRESHVSSVSVVSLILDFKSNFPFFFCVCILLDFRAISPHKTKLYWPMNQWTMIIRTMMNWVVMDSW